MRCRVGSTPIPLRHRTRRCAAHERRAACEFPDDLHYLVEHQVWARLDGDGTATVGITALGIRWPARSTCAGRSRSGSVVEQGRSIAVVELAKSIVSVKSPVRGTVVEVNARAGRRRRSSCTATRTAKAGWRACSSPTSTADRAALVHGEPVRRGDGSTMPG